MTSPGTKSSYPRPSQSLNSSLVGAVTLDMSGLAALMARGEKARCKGVVGEFARVGTDCADRAAAAAPAPTRTPPPSWGPAPASSAAAGRWGTVPELETRGGGGGVVRSPAPAGVRRGAARRSPAPT